MSDLEASIRAVYRPAPVEGTEPLVRLYDEETAAEIARGAAPQGFSELHFLALSFPPGLPAHLRALGIRLGLPIRPVLIPRELSLPSGRRPPVFVEAAELEAELVRHPDGTRDVQLVRFLPGLPISPQPPDPALRARPGFDFIDYWAIDFQYDPSSPFTHQWRWGRRSGKRKLLRQSDAHWPAEAVGKRMGVKAVDVFGYETTTVLQAG